ncbi:MAG: ATPase [Gammaproteobacteria bacterium]|nr:ATPase [Gammaproteobacteria bacterium]NIP14513.1 SRPBCC domain-containing protein [Pseudomonadales bacterium]NIT15050.1 ATPase [Gammaproteobacteria bacterium]NIX07802.1 ATPase [Pseudomonadales bacterium]
MRPSTGPRLAALFPLALLLAFAARAEVTAAGPNGFVSQHQLIIDASPERVYGALTEEVHAWWDAVHSYSGDAANLYLEPRALGCFCETLPRGGSIAHMQVVYVDPGTALRMVGGLGPLQGMGATGAMEFRLTPAEAGTRLDYRYHVSGFGIASMAEPVDRVQLGQLERLKGYVEASP